MTGFASVLGAMLVILMFSGCDGTLNEEEKGEITLKAGADVALYGKTIDNEDFDWESLRGKYVLVKFTATWCPPCQGQIPGMLEAYEKYHGKGLEIVSIYIWQKEADPVATVKNYVKEKRMPWIIISEALTERAGQPPQGEAFDIQGVPTMFLVNKEGKVLVDEEDYVFPAQGENLQRALKKLFNE
jgi:thiol-disulfide isomerase/thioredoxin